MGLEVSATPHRPTGSDISPPTVGAVFSITGFGINRDTGKIEKRAICKCDVVTQRGFVSEIFLVPKKNGGHRPVVNLKALNRFIIEEHFKMEGFHMVKDLVKPGDWMTKTRFERCLFSGTGRPQSPEVPSISMEWQSVPVSLPTVWPMLRPSHLHKVNETSGSFSEREGNPTDYISG